MAAAVELMDTPACSRRPPDAAKEHTKLQGAMREAAQNRCAAPAVFGKKQDEDQQFLKLT
jgi:hypothetical protein